MNMKQYESHPSTGQARPLVVVRYKDKITNEQYAAIQRRVMDKFEQIGWGCVIADEQGVNEVKVYGLQGEMMIGHDPFDLLVALANIHAPDSFHTELPERLAHRAPGSVSMGNYEEACKVQDNQQ